MTGYDAVIIGAGPAGLNAALVLGRCSRRVLLLDDDRPRNRVSQGIHGFITRDGVLPDEFRRLGLEDVVHYPSIEICLSETVTDVDLCSGGFEVLTDKGRRAYARKVLLATGVEDTLPEIPGFADFYGRGVYNCPYCDGWEQRGRKLVAYAPQNIGLDFAHQLTVWSGDVVLCTDGPSSFSTVERDSARKRGFAIEERRILKIEGLDDRLTRICLYDGGSLECDALFFMTGAQPRCEIADRLGCELTEKGVVRTKGNEKTNVPGFFVAGDASRRVQFAIVAAAEGALAAFEINKQLLQDG